MPAVKKSALSKTTPKQAAILAVNRQHPDMSLTDIGKITATNKSHVKRTLEAFGITKELTETYTSQRARIYQGIQAKILSEISNEDIQKAGLRDKCVAAGILHDHERIELGQSTDKQPVLVLVRGDNCSVQIGSPEVKKVVDNPVDNYDDSQVIDIAG
jgi:hypothetical protein